METRFRTWCENCGANEFEYNKEIVIPVELDPQGGMIQVSEGKERERDVICSVCGLRVDRRQLYRPHQDREGNYYLKQLTK